MKGGGVKLLKPEAWQAGWPPRVLISAFACEPGRGSEQEVGWKWSVGLAAAGSEVVVLTQTRNRPAIEKARAAGDLEGLPIQFIYLQFPGPIYRAKSRYDCLTWPYFTAWQWLALRRARELHAERPFDLVHHVTFATFRVPVRLHRLGVPVVLGPVGGADKAPWKLLLHRVGPADLLREGMRNLSTSAGIAALRVMSLFGTAGGISLAATPAMFEAFRRAGLRSEIFPTIGVDVNPLEEPPAASAGERLRFLFVGRLHVLKGLQLLFDAFARVEGDDWSLTVVGDGPERERLRRQVSELGLDARVTFTGKLAREELAGVFRDHDVVCAPSLYESGGLAVVEGMERGKPAIVLDVGGNAVSVTEDCGVKVDATGSAEEVIAGLAAAIRAYTMDSELRRRHSLGARRRIESHYNWRTKVPRMFGYYRIVLAGNEQHSHHETNAR